MGATRLLERLDRYLSPNPAKRKVELYWLAYTPVWGLTMGGVMVSGLADRWGDLPLMVLGVALMVGMVAGPIWLERGSDLPWWRRTSIKMAAGIVVLSFGMNYSQTPYFYDVLHMHYGFGTQWTIRNNPLFLYFVTTAYFSTYCVLCMIAYRMMRGRLGWAAWLVAPVLMAFLETVLNANPFLARLFCYDDMSFMLWFGTASYSISFILALPVWLATDETRKRSIPIHHVVIGTLAVVYVDVLLLDALRYNVAPHFTEVVEGAQGLGDHPDSCLEAPRR